MLYEVADDVLIFLARQKHPEAIRIILDKMQQKQDRLIRKLMNMHRYDGLDFDDLKMVAIQTLFLAIDSYHPQKNVFDAYYHFLLSRELINEFKRFSAPNHQPIISAISLDMEMEDGASLAEMIGHEDDKIKQPLDNPFQILLESNDHHLTPQEKAIISYVQQGYSYTEIGKIMHMKYRQVSKIVHALIVNMTPLKKALYD